MTKPSGLGVQLGMLFVLQLNNPTSPGSNEKVGLVTALQSGPASQLVS